MEPKMRPFKMTDKRAQTNGEREVDPDTHTWVVIQVAGLTEEQAREFADPDNEVDTEIAAIVLTTQGPQCWVCDKTWEEAHDNPCRP